MIKFTAYLLMSLYFHADINSKVLNYCNWCYKTIAHFRWHSSIFVCRSLNIVQKKEIDQNYSLLYVMLCIHLIVITNLLA